MNYMRLLVHPTKGENRSTHEATVVAHGRDLFGSLELAVALLEQRGWGVDDLKEFRIAESPEEVAVAGSAAELFEAARSEGCACEVHPLDEPAARTGVLEGESYSDVRAVRLLGL